MKRLAEIFVFIFCLNIIACSARSNNTSNDYVIRYINLNLVYEYVYNNTNEARDIKRKLDSFNKKIEDLENSEDKSSISDLYRYKNEIVKLKEQEKKLKSELYSGIKAAISNIAVKHNADFILNSGDGVVYSRPVYDLTYEVIKELRSQNERTSPVNK